MNFFQRQLDTLKKRTEMTTPSLRDQFVRVQRIYSIVGLRIMSVPMSRIVQCIGYVLVVLAAFVLFFTLRFFIFKDVDMTNRVPAIIGFMVAAQSTWKSLQMIIFKQHFTQMITKVIDESEESLHDRDAPDFVIGTEKHTFVHRFLLGLSAVFLIACTQISFFPVATRQPFMLPVSYEIPGIDHQSHPGYEINYSYIVMQAYHACFVLLSMLIM